MSKNYAEMGKVELRAACKAVGIPYGKLNNDGMRAALVAKDEATMAVEKVNAPAPAAPAAPNSEGDTIDKIFADLAVPRDAPVVTAPAIPHGAGAGAGAASGNGGTGLKIEKNREERNGVKRPSIGGMCRAVWDLLDGMVKDGESPTAKMVKTAAEANKWNVNNASIEFYQWRKFHGITGRQIKADKK